MQAELVIAGKRVAFGRSGGEADVVPSVPDRVEASQRVELLLAYLRNKTAQQGPLRVTAAVMQTRVESCKKYKIGNRFPPGPCKGSGRGGSSTSVKSPARTPKPGNRQQSGGRQIDFAERERRVEDSVGKALKTLATDKTHTREPGGTWLPERDKIHREIVDSLFAKAADVPREGKAVIAGGLGGAGKTTVLRDHAGIDPKKYLTVNPDDIKEEMARRGLVPEIPDAKDLSPMERAALVHEESSRIAQMLADRAYREKANLIWDITMSSDSSVRSRVKKMRDAGYDDIEGVFVDIPTEVSVQRALSRYRRGIENWERGQGFGGRYVPPSIIRAQKTASGNSTINREVFEGLKSEFNNWAAYDNSVDGRAPQLIERKEGR